tara:strand:+ start:203 stop:469 length:267 start_codon:yes stop_codon:yes gene_type:complete
MITDNPPSWQRALYMILFAIIAYIVLWFVFFLALMQFLLATINGTENEHLQHFTARVNAYFGEILGFLAYTQNEVPFPFSPLPDAPDV